MRANPVSKMRFPSTALLLAVALASATLATPAQANVGYELDASNPSHNLPGPPRGIAIDQTSQDIYVAIVSTNTSIGTPGEIQRFNSDLTADGIFSPQGGFYTGVAVNPVTHGFYASQTKIDQPIGSFGVAKLDRFSSTGASEGSFPIPDAGSLPPIATDSTGRIFFPNSDGHKVEIFDSAGNVKEQITCGACPGGAFGRPISVAVDSANNLYVADISPDRVVKLSLSGGSYSYASTIQSGRGAAAVAVDPSSGDILVGDIPNGRNYHIVAYNSSGTEFDDFGGVFPDPPQEPPGAATNAAYQMAINGNTHKLYVGADNKFYVFEKTTIDPPTATIKPATTVGQLVATLNATVNMNGHTALACKFEYTISSDTGFASASSVPCAETPSGSASKNLALQVPGLTPDTAYRFRMQTSSHAGSVTSGSTTFETLPVKEATITAESPVLIEQTGATLKGKVNPQGGSTSDCHFELGTSTSYGLSYSCSNPPGPVTTDVTQSRKVTGLSPGTTYHYRLVVTTNAGTVEGKNVTFTTASPPTEPKPETPISPPTSLPPAPDPPPTGEPPQPKKCKRGFHRRKVRGKVRCVKRHPRKRRHGR